MVQQSPIVATLFPFGASQVEETTHAQEPSVGRRAFLTSLCSDRGLPAHIHPRIDSLDLIPRDGGIGGGEDQSNDFLSYVKGGRGGETTNLHVTTLRFLFHGERREDTGAFQGCCLFFLTNGSKRTGPEGVDENGE